MNALALALLLTTIAAAPAPDRSKPPPLGAPASYAFVEPQAFQLKNGVRVLLIERTRAPLIDVVVNIDGGVDIESVELAGVGSALSAMLLEGAGDRDALAFADAQAAIATEIGAGTGLQSSSIMLHAALSRADAALALLADAVIRPRLEAHDWQRVQQNVLSQLLLASQDPSALGSLAAARVAWGAQHRFAYDSQGTPRSITSLTRDQIVAHHRARYRPDATTIIVVGPLNKKAATAKLEAAFGGWRADGAAPARPSLAPPVTRDQPVVIGIQMDGAPQTVIRVVAPAGAVRPYDAPAEVMNTLLGGSFTSRLVTNLREEHGYAYGAGSHMVFTPAGALFSVRTNVQANATVLALGEIGDELDRIRTPAADDEVTRARNLVALDFPSAFDGGGSTAVTYSELWSERVDAARVRAFLAAAPQVTIDDVKKSAAAVVQPQRAATVLVGDLREHRAALARFGAIEMMTANDVLPGLDQAARAP